MAKKKICRTQRSSDRTQRRRQDLAIHETLRIQVCQDSYFCQGEHWRHYHQRCELSFVLSQRTFTYRTMHLFFLKSNTLITEKPATGRYTGSRASEIQIFWQVQEYRQGCSLCYWFCDFAEGDQRRSGVSTTRTTSTMLQMNAHRNKHVILMSFFFFSLPQISVHTVVRSSYAE